MIMTGMSLESKGSWCDSQLTQELQYIIAKHIHLLNGEPVTAEDVKTEYDSE